MEDLDILNNFSLDMVSTDMNFEQAYSMYNHLQQEQAINAVDNLERIQQSIKLESKSQSPFESITPMVDRSRGLSLPNLNDAVDDDDEEEEEEEEEEFDKFFSNTESNALEKFLDNLANPTTSNPLDIYNHEFTFEPKKEYKADLKAFAHPPPTKFESPQPTNTFQLPTPESSLSSIDEEFEEPTKKKQRLNIKPLLSLEQKRLNHSHSEQKRRQLCKAAYERCLRLITNFESYKRLPPINKKSKRKQFTKDGLPNLSKHCALMKISYEMTKIKRMNDELEKLLR